MTAQGWRDSNSQPGSLSRHRLSRDERFGETTAAAHLRHANSTEGRSPLRSASTATLVSCPTCWLTPTLGPPLVPSLKSGWPQEKSLEGPRPATSAPHALNLRAPRRTVMSRKQRRLRSYHTPLQGLFVRARENTTPHSPEDPGSCASA
ncbi:UNVERIFIED_CONTAM: hypothetical protein K2H54_051987 [Gekko kuhli]